ncbi:MAG: GNAT family N-acetyltransferase [Candidatus Thorarchaeota archaeon]|jgi:ribosomal-protein-alanine N-acetyltransferase
MIRRVQLKDLDEIMKIERQSFPVAWEYSIFLNICLQSGHISSGDVGTMFMDVIEENDKITGYAVWKIDTRTAEGHILNLAIQVSERRKGKGKILLTHVIHHLETNSIRTCRLEVRKSNLPARALYESNGFVASGDIPGYYFDDDAIVYSRDLQSRDLASN